MLKFNTDQILTEDVKVTSPKSQQTPKQAMTATPG